MEGTLTVDCSCRYFTMRKLGMPDGVIAHKLKMDGIELDILRCKSAWFRHHIVTLLTLF